MIKMRSHHPLLVRGEARTEFETDEHHARLLEQSGLAVRKPADELVGGGTGQQMAVSQTSTVVAVPELVLPAVTPEGPALEVAPDATAVMTEKPAPETTPAAPAVTTEKPAPQAAPAPTSGKPKKDK